MNILWLSCTAEKNPRTPLCFPLFFGFFWRLHSHCFHIWSFIVCHRIKENFLLVGLKCLLLDDYFFTGKEPRCSMIFERTKCMLSSSYWEADQTCCNTQGQLRFNDAMRVSPIPAHDILNLQKKINLCLNFCLALHISNTLRQLLL